MTVWIAFAAGVFVGWVIEWIIDWLYWRRNLAGFYATETQLRNKLAASQARVDELNAENETLRAQLAPAAEETPSAVQADGERVVGDEGEPAVAEAADAASGDEADAKPVIVETADMGGDDEAGKVAAEPAETSEAAAESSLEAGAAAHAPAADVQPDDLTQISGIGPVYRRKLHEAGVKTFAQLAGLTPAELTEIIQPTDFQKPAFEQWIVDADRLAAQPAGDDVPAASTDGEG